jgi:putative effector of murein hydrolase
LFVIITRIIGAVTVPPLMNLLRITDWRARGFAAHVIGTARAFQVNPVAGTYVGIAMALNALLTRLIVTLLERWLVWKRFNLVLVRRDAWREGLGKWVPS